MGNVVSVVLVYALQAAWMCQRIIDRDFSQNHGSRPKPISDETEKTEPDSFLPKSSSTPNGYLTRSPHHRSKLVRNDKQKKNADRFLVSDAKDKDKDKEKTRHRKRRFGTSNRPISESRQLCRNFDSDSENYLEYRNRSRHRLGHRRAFSDFDNDYIFAKDENRLSTETTDDNHNNLVEEENVDDTMISTVDQEILRLVLSRGCMTEKRNDFSACSVL